MTLESVFAVLRESYALPRLSMAARIATLVLSSFVGRAFPLPVFVQVCRLNAVVLIHDSSTLMTRLPEARA